MQRTISLALPQKHCIVYCFMGLYQERDVKENILTTAILEKNKTIIRNNPVSAKSKCTQVRHPMNRYL